MAKETRVEIKREEDGNWVQIVLRPQPIKYNLVANRIGTLNQRRIFHSDTFSLPYVEENISALGINVFSPKLLAQALNRKYRARYYVNNKLLQQGWLVVNNTITGDINVNFIDEALEIVDQWGVVTFKDLLLNLVESPNKYTTSNISPSVLSLIQDMSRWNMERNQPVAAVQKVQFENDDPTIDGNEFWFARFPVMMNTIGSQWQISQAAGYENKRPLNTFNPFQSRPIFSVLGFLYLIAEAWGYKLKVDQSVNYQELRDSYLSEKGATGGNHSVSAYVISETDTIKTNVTHSYYKQVDKIGDNADYGKYEFFFEYPVRQVIDINPSPPPLFNVIQQVTYDASTGVKTGVGGYQNATFNSHPPGRLQHRYGSEANQSIFNNRWVVAKIEGNQSSWDGELKWTGRAITKVPNNRFNWDEFEVKAIGIKKSDNSIYEIPMTHTVNFPTSLSHPSSRNFEIVANKLELRDIWDESQYTFYGVELRIVILHEDNYFKSIPYLTDLHFTEANLPKGNINIDKYGQIEDGVANLNALAPDILIKDLLADVLQQQGLLLTFEKDSNGIQNIMKIFSYGLYSIRSRAAQANIPDSHYDWSSYHQKYVAPLFNTDYGSSYGETNRISLKNPFNKENFRVRSLGTQLLSKGQRTKFLPLVENQPKILTDVTAIDIIGDTVTYEEVTTEDKSLVYCDYNVANTLTKGQVWVEDATPTVSVSEIAVAQIIPYTGTSSGGVSLIAPTGVEEWYDVVEQSIKCEATFLLPIYVVQNFDISKPIFVEALGGFYLVEEIPEYIDDVTPIRVKLIKVPI